MFLEIIFYQLLKGCRRKIKTDPIYGASNETEGTSSSHWKPSIPIWSFIRWMLGSWRWQETFYDRNESKGYWIVYLITNSLNITAIRLKDVVKIMKQLELCTPEPTKIDLEKTEVNSYAPSVSTIVKSEQTVKERIQIDTPISITSHS